MKKIKVLRMNWGRWIWRCPQCQTKNDTKLTDGFCLHCYPGTKDAVAYMIKPGYENKSRRKQMWIKVPDLEEREAQKKKAKQYEITLPEDAEKIFETLRPRHISLMNWEWGETVKYLKKENKELGVK